MLRALAAGLAAWWRVGAGPPDGTYALLRHDEQAVQLLSDITASRTLWYVLDEERLLASTSQRALVALMVALATPSAPAPTLPQRILVVMKAARVVLPARLFEPFAPAYRGPDPLPAPSLAFRALLASRTIALLRMDASLLAREPAATGV